MTVHEARLGRYLEDFVVGDVYRHPLGRTVTATDNAWFTNLTMNTNQMHFNDHYAAGSPFGRQLVVSTLTVALVTGLSVGDVSQNGIANLAWDEVRMPAPVFVGDTIYAESVVLEVRESASRPYAGIVTVGSRGLNQDGGTVLTFRRTVMVYRRGSTEEHEHYPLASSPISDAFRPA